jgi:large subunit ribosomal protein L4
VEQPVYNTAGEVTESVQLNQEIFGIEPNTSVMHQALVRQQANARLGTVQTKTRGLVSGGGRKPWRQKGTGRARQGSTRAPQWRGGGIVFGPHPRSYYQSMPRKMRRLAIRSALSQKAANNQIFLVNDLAGIEPKTKAFVDVLNALKIGDAKVLVVIPEKTVGVQKAASNLSNVKVILAPYLNVLDLLRYDYTVVSLGAVKKIEEILG